LAGLAGVAGVAALALGAAARAAERRGVRQSGSTPSSKSLSSDCDLWVPRFGVLESLPCLSASPERLSPLPDAGRRRRA